MLLELLEVICGKAVETYDVQQQSEVLLMVKLVTRWNIIMSCLKIYSAAITWVHYNIST